MGMYCLLQLVDQDVAYRFVNWDVLFIAGCRWEYTVYCRFVDRDVLFFADFLIGMYCLLQVC